MAERTRRNDLQELLSVTGEVEQFEDFDAEFKESGAVAFAGPIEIDFPAVQAALQADGLIKAAKAA